MPEVPKGEMKKNSEYIVHISNKGLLENEKKLINDFVALLKKGMEIPYEVTVKKHDKKKISEVFKW